MRLEFTVAAPDGRRLQVEQVGPARGRTLLFHNGTPNSRLLPPGWEALADRRGVRILAWDRPGYGSSTRQADRTVASVAADAAAVADHAGAARFLTAGISGGGPHALATAALLPDRVAAAAVLGSVGPWGASGLDWLAGMGELNVEEFQLARQGREAFAPVAERQARELLTADRAAIIEFMRTLLCPPDRAALSAELGEYLAESMRLGLAAGAGGWVDDDMCFLSPWGVELDRIRVPVLVAHGEQDTFVPVAHGRWLAGAIPGAETWIEPEHGHLSLLARFDAILDWLLGRAEAAGL